MPLNRSIKKVLVIGSGPIIIGQAAEFDYSGTQACQALKEEGIEVVLVNSNPATIMTDKEVADKIYIEPLTLEFVEKVIAKERPDSLLAGMGGQTGLNLAVDLHDAGILDKYNVKATFFVLGTSIAANDQAKALLKKEVARGHAIGNHTYSHNYSYLYPNKVMNVNNIVSDLQKNENAMKEVLGKDFTTRVIRLPGGYWSWDGRTAMKEAMEQDGYYNVDWNALDKDAEGPKKNADQLVQCTKESVEALGPNADSVVLLMHDTYGKEETVKALPRIIEYLQSQGFEFRTIK